jgi:23S rRNA pseudouridine1911/1915/1917 synthase
VHLYALGYPILGDELYSAPPTELIHRVALHACSLEFTHPVTKERVEFTAPYPADFQAALETLQIRDTQGE